MQHTRLNDHIKHKSGEVKTVCVTACLTALGVPLDGFHYTGSVSDNRRESILRRHGYAVRSRMSKLGKNPTTGTARKAIREKMDDPKGTMYLVIVYSRSGAWSHAILLDQDGNTVVDTDPRKVDRRKVWSIKAVYKKEGA